MKFEKVNVSELPDAERRMVTDLEAHGIEVVVTKLGDANYCCGARYNDVRDPVVTYAKTPETAVRQTDSVVRGSWPDLFEEQGGSSAACVDD